MDIEVRQIVVWVCQPCLDGEGSECHTPGCALFLHRIDLPIHPELYTVIGGYLYDDKEACKRIGERGER